MSINRDAHLREVAKDCGLTVELLVYTRSAGWLMQIAETCGDYSRIIRGKTAFDVLNGIMLRALALARAKPWRVPR